MEHWAAPLHDDGGHRARTPLKSWQLNPAPIHRQSEKMRDGPMSMKAIGPAEDAEHRTGWRGSHPELPLGAADVAKQYQASHEGRLL